MSRTFLTNGHIYLNRDQFVEALVIEDGLIQAVGTPDMLSYLVTPETEVVDLEGRTVIPGFNDSHLHLAMKGQTLDDIDLLGARSIAECAERVANYIATRNPAPGTVLHGRGWNQDYFVEDNHRLLTRRELDAMTTDYPLILERACGHILAANTPALELAGITRDSHPVEGGEYDRDENGDIVGIVRENACETVLGIIPVPTDEDVKRQLVTAMNYALSHGVTSVQTMDMRPRNWEQMWRLYGEIAEENPLVRVYHQVNFMEPEGFRRFLKAGFKTGVGNAWNRIGPLKMFLDGSLGARTALMRQPYHDDPSVRGIATLTPDQVADMVELAVKHGCQVAMHAIGDGAIILALNTYLPYTQDGKNPLRLGIIHVQITNKELLQRFADQQVLAYVQPIFLHYDIQIVEDRVGKGLAATSYAFRTLVENGTPTSLGTDCPVEEISPFDNLYCAVTRKNLNGSPEGGFHPEEALDIYQAVDAYTVGSAYASFEDDVKGRLLPGCYADLVILSKDIFSIPAEEIRSVEVIATMTGGRFVYQRA